MSAAGGLGAVVLHEGRERSLRRGHPWVLSGSVARVEGAPAAGDPVRVLDAGGRELGVGDFDPDSQIRVRVCHWGASTAFSEEEWLPAAVDRALALRAEHPLLADTDALRLINGEGDALPGLTADQYGPCLVVRLGTPGMQRRAPRIAQLLAARTASKGAWLRGDVPGELERALFGDVPEEGLVICERGRRYRVDLRHGQKTGFYLDQRDSRDLFQRLAPGRRALDLFAYTGGFAAAARAGGAASVVAVESSARAVELLRENAPGVEAICGDVARFLREDGRSFELLALDPPPLARHKRDVAAAARAYKDLNLRALRRAAPGALLLTFSCSHHVDAVLFRKIVFGAAQDAKRRVQLLGQLGAPADHPVDLCHPEGEYLKGFLLRVSD
jgi:23S rRNA (cytosine1962-C5)-methyltransferase